MHGGQDKHTQTQAGTHVSICAHSCSGTQCMLCSHSRYPGTLTVPRREHTRVDTWPHPVLHKHIAHTRERVHAQAHMHRCQRGLVLSPQWSYGFYLIHLQGKQGFQFFCKTEDMKRRWMEQFEMAM